MKIYSCHRCHRLVTEIIVYHGRRVAVCVQCLWQKEIGKAVNRDDKK